MSDQTDPKLEPDDAIRITTGSRDDPPETTEEQKEAGMLERVRKRFEVHQNFWQAIFAEALVDDAYVAGRQWPEQMKKEREEDQRPCLTYNLLPAFNRQITNKMRQDRPQPKVEPVEKDKQAPRFSNVEGTKDYSTADVINGIIKNCEHISRAEQAYDTAAKHAVDHGFGWFYVIPEWSRFDPFVQDLMIKRVKNAYTVTLDPGAEDADYMDAQDGFIYTNMQKDVFEARWPDINYSEFEGNTGETYSGWYDEDELRISNYFWLEYVDDEVLKLSNRMTVYASQVKGILDDIEKEYGVFVQKDAAGNDMRKAVKRPVCKWMKHTADHILEGPLDLPFSVVPIMFVSGEELVLDGETIYESAIRHARDPQMSYNYWRTAGVETVALAPRAPWIGTSKMFEGHQDKWEAANRRNLPYLEYNVDSQAPQAKPERVSPPSTPAAELTNATQDGIDMQTIIGLHDASLGRESNEKSGRAIRARQDQGSTSTFQFPDNMARAMEKMTRCLIEAIPAKMNGDRIARIRLPDGKSDFVRINYEVVDEATKKVKIVNDITYGRYDVTIDTGPSYNTQRQEAAELQIELLKILGPEQAQNIAHLIVQNMGLPGADEVAFVLRKMLPDFLKTPEEILADVPEGVKFDEEGNLVNADGSPYVPPPTPQQQIIQQDQALKQQELEVEGKKADAELAAAEAKKEAEKTRQLSAQASLEKNRAEAEQAKRETGAGTVSDVAEMRGNMAQAAQEVFAEYKEQLADVEQRTEELVERVSLDVMKRMKAYIDQQMTAQRPAPRAAGGGGGQ